MPKRSSSAAPSGRASKASTKPKPAKAAKPTKAAATLPQQFEAAVLAATPDELRAYLRNLATRERTTRADFLLWRAAQSSADSGTDRASVLQTIRLGLKQSPKLPRRGWYDGPVPASGKRLLRLCEIAAALLPAARRHLADRSDLPAVRATGLGLLEAEITELAPDVNWDYGVADLPHPAALTLLRDLWNAFPAAEARELLWTELLAVGRAGHPDAPAHLALLGLLAELAPHHPDGSTAAYRTALALADDLLRRQPVPPPAPPARPRRNLYEYSPQDQADAVVNSERTRLNGHRDKLRLLRLQLFGHLHPTAAAADLLADLQPDLLTSPHLRSKAADILLALDRPLDARTLLEEGLAASSAESRNWQHSFKQLLLKVEQALPSRSTSAGAAADPSRRRALARELLFAHDFDTDADAFLALRATYPAAEWPAARAALLADVATELARRFGQHPNDSGRAHRLAEIDLNWSVAEADPERTAVVLETVPSATLLLRYHELVPITAVTRLLAAAERLLPAYMIEYNSRQPLEKAAKLLARLVRHAPEAPARLAPLAADLRARFPRRTVLQEVLRGL